MEMFERMNIRSRLLAAFFVVVLVAVVQSFYGMYQTQLINDKSTEISINWLPSVKYVSDLNTNTSDFRIAQLQHVLADNDAAMDKYERKWRTF